MGNDDSGEHSWDDVATAISAEPLALDVSAKQRPCLVVLAGSRVGEMVNIGDGFTIGRGAESDFRINDEGVSRIHLRITRSATGQIRVLDTDSRNGTYLNGELVHDAELHDGDKIYIGTKAILRFSYADYLEEKFQQRMYEAALRDPLTGLFNRRHLLSQLTYEYRFVERHGTQLTIVMIDLDHFKRINDHYGHLVGDEVLCGFGECMRKATRAGDIAARYGGEEFALVCRGISALGGVRVADRLREEVAGARLVASEPDLRVTFSAGVAAAPHPAIGDPSDLLRAADGALYEAKHGGRNCVRTYSVEA